MKDDGVFRLCGGRDVTVLMRRVIPLNKPSDNEIVIYVARDILSQLGFTATDEFMVASAASELATNILRYAGSGEIELSTIQNGEGHTGIELLARDRGPGIPDVEKAMRDQYSTTQNSLGSGLPSVKRIMDEFAIESYPGRGTRVLTRKWNVHDRG